MRSKTIIMTAAIAAVAVTLLGMTTVTEAQQIDGQGMEMIATADEGSDTIMITGTIIKSLPTPVSIIVTSPSGANIVDIHQVTPVDNEFEATIEIDNLWKENGTYTITATSGSGESSLYKVSLLVTVVGGVVYEDTIVIDGNLERLQVYEEESGVIPENATIPESLTYDEIEKKWQFWKDKSMDQKAEIKDLEKENKKLKKELEKVRNIRNSMKDKLNEMVFFETDKETYTRGDTIHATIQLPESLFENSKIVPYEGTLLTDTVHEVISVGLMSNYNSPMMRCERSNEHSESTEQTTYWNVTSEESNTKIRGHNVTLVEAVDGVWYNVYQILSGNTQVDGVYTGVHNTAYNITSCPLDGNILTVSLETHPNKLTAHGFVNIWVESLQYGDLQKGAILGPYKIYHSEPIIMMPPPQ